MNNWTTFHNEVRSEIQKRQAAALKWMEEAPDLLSASKLILDKDTIKHLPEWAIIGFAQYGYLCLLKEYSWKKLQELQKN